MRWPERSTNPPLTLANVLASGRVTQLREWLQTAILSGAMMGINNRPIEQFAVEGESGRDPLGGYLATSRDYPPHRRLVVGKPSATPHKPFILSYLICSHA
jgi:hypothetical protein